VDWYVEVRHGGLGAARSGKTWLGGQGEARQGAAGFGGQGSVRLGLVRCGEAVEVWSGAVWSDSVRLGTARRSRSGVFGQGPDGHGTAVVVGLVKVGLG
jgi:hypothetical protein